MAKCRLHKCTHKRQMFRYWPGCFSTYFFSTKFLKIFTRTQAQGGEAEQQQQQQQAQMATTPISTQPAHGQVVIGQFFGILWMFSPFIGKCWENLAYPTTTPSGGAKYFFLFLNIYQFKGRGDKQPNHGGQWSAPTRGTDGRSGVIGIIIKSLYLFLFYFIWFYSNDFIWFYLIWKIKNLNGLICFQIKKYCCKIGFIL